MIFTSRQNHSFPLVLLSIALSCGAIQLSRGHQYRDDHHHAGRLLARHLSDHDQSQFSDGPPQPPDSTSDIYREKRMFAMELLRMLHAEYAITNTSDNQRQHQQPRASSHVDAGDSDDSKMQERRSSFSVSIPAPGSGAMRQLLDAISADGDMRRLVDWIQNSFSLTTLSDVTTQFVVGKLGSVNCPAILSADREDTLVPRFLLFNENFLDVPFELSIKPSLNECVASAKFDPLRKTLVLIHGFLAGYTLVDGVTNIKNRALDLNKVVNERALDVFLSASRANGSYVLAEDLQSKVRQQQFNVIIVDWYNGANPSPRANYIRSAVNAQVVGRLIARFLSALIVQCTTPASNIQIIAHSLGCHVSGFTGKALNAAGHRLGKITHLDPIGLCFGRLFSQPRYRLSPDDALETLAVHVSLNIFDNPLDGAHSNFLVNGGRDQPGCGGQSEVKNSTTSSVSLLFDSAVKFAPCSHLRALALFEDDHSSQPDHCQLVGYRCADYDRFLAGKCGQCDAANSQCKLMSLPPVNVNFRRLNIMPSAANYYETAALTDPLDGLASALISMSSRYKPTAANYTALPMDTTLVRQTATNPSSVTPQRAVSSAPADMYGAPSNYAALTGNELRRRSDRRLSSDQRDRLAQAIERLRQDARTKMAEGWTSLRQLKPVVSLAANADSHWQMGADMHSDQDIAQAADEHSYALAAAPLPTTVATDGIASATSNQQRATTTSATTTSTTSTLWKQQQDARAAQDAASASRTNLDLSEQMPTGAQEPPSGSLNGPLYFLGTDSVSPFCLNYYQFRVLIAESRLTRMLRSNQLASNKISPPPQIANYQTAAQTVAKMQQRANSIGNREMLHLTVKLSDSSGHFFKGFTMLENARDLNRVLAGDMQAAQGAFRPAPASNGDSVEPMVELTMLLNSTQPNPVKIGETIISYYFHPIVLADKLEVNYMSNISPEIRARYSSVLCPTAINDRHQLVRYIECSRAT